MHDIRLIREKPAAFDSALERRGHPLASAKILDLDSERRRIATAVQNYQGRRNELSKQIAMKQIQGGVPGLGNAIRDILRSEKKDVALVRRQESQLEAELIILQREASQLKEKISSLENEERETSAYLQNTLAALPNRPAEDVPDGEDETGNVEQKVWGQKREFNYAPANHADLGPTLGLDFETGALISGARFTFLRGQMARLQRALGQFMLDAQVANGFVECAVPLLVRDEAMFGTGQLPKFENDSFATGKDPYEGIGVADEHGIVSARGSTKKDRLWLIPTAEVSLTNSIREQILADSQLPIKMTALTPCFRSEAGSTGKDTRGYIRQHQFEKVELVTICRPEDSAAEHETMTLAAEAILEALDLPYRRMLLCAGDMGFSARKTYDLEVWLPGQDAYREISSISDCGDFQARRMNAQYRPEGQSKGPWPYVHTLNGSGLAVGRTLVAVLENYQQEDGSVEVPEALVQYMGGVTRLTPAQ